MISTTNMLDNAAAASQDRALLMPVTRGAVLRSMVQWLSEQQASTVPELIRELKEDNDYDD